MSSTRIAQDGVKRPARRRLPHRFPGGLTASLVLFALLVSGAGTGAAASRYDPASDGYSMAQVTSQMGATAWWNAGYTGKSIDIALIDSGVAPVPGLNSPGQGRLRPRPVARVAGPSLRNLDTYGHGTFMAGLIAGHDSALTAPYANAPGVALPRRRTRLPGSSASRSATADGGVDVTQVIAAIDWVVQHAHDTGLEHPRHQPLLRHQLDAGYTVDPLAYAAEQAWKHGIVVVAAAGNTGYRRSHSAPGLADPAYDPYVIGGRRLRHARDRGHPGRQGRRLLDCHGQRPRRARTPISSRPARTCRDCAFRVATSTRTTRRRASTAAISAAPAPPRRRPSRPAASRCSQKARASRRTRSSGSSSATARSCPEQMARRKEAAAANLSAMLHGAPQGSAPSRGRSHRRVLTGPKRGRIGTGPLVLLQPAVAASYILQGTTAPAARYPDSSGSGSLQAARGLAHLSRAGRQLTADTDSLGHLFGLDAIAQADARATPGREARSTAWPGAGTPGRGTRGAATAGAPELGFGPLELADAVGTSEPGGAHARESADSQAMTGATTKPEAGKVRPTLVGLSPIWLFNVVLAATAAALWLTVLRPPRSRAGAGDARLLVVARPRLLPRRGLRRPRPGSRRGAYEISLPARWVPGTRSLRALAVLAAARPARRRLRRARLRPAPAGREARLQPLPARAHDLGRGAVFRAVVQLGNPFGSPRGGSAPCSPPRSPPRSPASSSSPSRSPRRGGITVGQLPLSAGISILATVAVTNLVLIAIELSPLRPPVARAARAPGRDRDHAFRAFASQSRRHEHLEFLYESMKATQGAPEFSLAVGQLLITVRRLVRAEYAEIFLFPAGDEQGLRSKLGGGGEMTAHQDAIGPADQQVLAALAAASTRSCSRRPVRRTRSTLPRLAQPGRTGYRRAAQRGRAVRAARGRRPLR